jgi:hypothetical protein
VPCLCLCVPPLAKPPDINIVAASCVCFACGDFPMSLHVGSYLVFVTFPSFEERFVLSSPDVCGYSRTEVAYVGPLSFVLFKGGYNLLPPLTSFSSCFFWWVNELHVQYPSCCSDVNLPCNTPYVGH